MKGTVAIVAALPGELKPLVSPKTGVRWRRLKVGKDAKGAVLWELEHEHGRWIAGCSGMGGARALVTLQEMERYGRVDAICSVGWVGALDAEISAASVWRVGQVIDSGTGERFVAEQTGKGGGDWPVLVTVNRVADAKEKQRLAATYGARLVDMEAATLARVAQARGVPFFCLKAVSDDVDAQLVDFNRFVSARGQMRIVPFLGHVGVRPASWRGLVKLGRHSSMAARHLAATVQDWLEEA